MPFTNRKFFYRIFLPSLGLFSLLIAGIAYFESPWALNFEGLFLDSFEILIFRINFIVGYILLLLIIYATLLHYRWPFAVAGLIIMSYFLNYFLTPNVPAIDPNFPVLNAKRSQNPKFSCKRDSDCQLYCEGAYNKAWMAEKEQRAWDEYEKKEYGAGIVIPPNIDCFDGCVWSKGRDAACVDHQCVAVSVSGPYRKFDPSCTPTE